MSEGDERGVALHLPAALRPHRWDVSLAEAEAIQRDLSADRLLAPLVRARPGLRLPGDWIDMSPNGATDMASDRLDDERLKARAEQWRPWRAYGVLHLREAGIDSARIMESDDEKDAA